MAEGRLVSPNDTHSTTSRALSAEIFAIPIDQGRYIIYAPLRKAAFVGNTRVVNFLADLKAGVLDDSTDPDGSLAELLRRLEIIGAGPEELPAKACHGDPQPTGVTLFLTTACNLRCTYCYASAGDAPGRFMSLEVARRGIDFVADNARKCNEDCFEVAYHGGGEPTVHWPVMTGSLEYAREKAAKLNLECRSYLATNGVLNDEQADWIIANLDGASLSFDGSPSEHDKHRLTVLGQGSSHRVMRTLRHFDAAGFPYGVRVTVTADQIPHLPQSIEFICTHFEAERIQVEPSYKLGRWRTAPSAETGEFIAAFRAAQECASRHGREVFFSAARLGTLTNHFCAVSQDNFCLSPDGNVSACYEAFSEDGPWAKVFFYGRPDVAGGYQFDIPVLENLRKQAVEHREFCQGCYAKWTCAGDCYHKSLTVSGNGEFAGSERCHITRELTKDQILAKIAASGGLIWHDPPGPMQGAE